MAVDGIKGRRRPLSGRKAKVYPDNRVCAKDKCTVVMSKYNKSKFCFHHTPRTHGRVRGQQKR